MKYIDEVILERKRILLRVDFNVSLNAKHHIANDERIKQTLPTIEYLLQRHNTLLLLSHLGKPKGVTPSLSLAEVAKRLQSLLPGRHVVFVSDYTSLLKEKTRTDNSNTLFLLENLRFHEGEEKNLLSFAKDLAVLGEVYVNDAFSVSHRECASITLLPTLLPSFAGLLMKKEISALSLLLKDPKKPVVSLLGGAKVSTKIKLLKKIIMLSDEVLLGGGLANTFLKAKGREVGRSFYEATELHTARELLALATKHGTSLLLPVDAVIGNKTGSTTKDVVITNVSSQDTIFDIGPQTQALYAQSILHAKTIIWNGPFGVIEEEAYSRGTDFLYYAIAQNTEATSVVGGGETLAALHHKEHLDKITHISTGGGAMLFFLENGTLPGIAALSRPVR